jgi:hypothetical protein
VPPKRPRADEPAWRKALKAAGLQDPATGAVVIFVVVLLAILLLAFGGGGAGAGAKQRVAA